MMSHMSLTWVDFVSIAGTVGTFGFGYVALKQRSEIEGMKTAIKTHVQATFNALFYVGIQTEKLLAGQSVDRGASEINAISHTARNAVISFGREYAGAVPFYEPAWEPNSSGGDLKSTAH